MEGRPERDCTESDEIKIVKKETRIRPQIFTATSALPTPLSGFRPFRHQVGGHLKVEENPCKIACIYHDLSLSFYTHVFKFHSLIYLYTRVSPVTYTS